MNTKALRQKILDLAIHGKLVPQDPNDEPASVLLERIRAEKERLVKEGKIKRPKKTNTTSDKPHYENVPFEVPSSWVWTTLGEICIFLSRGKSPKYKDDDRTYPVFAQKCNLKEGGISLEQVRFIDPNTIDKWAEEYKLKTGDILINSTGTGTVGRTRLFNESCLGDYPFVVPDSHVSVVRIHDEILSEFIYAYISSNFVQQYFEENLAGSTNQKELYIGVLDNLNIPLPPYKEQKRIADEIERWSRQIYKIDDDRDNLTHTIKQVKNKVLDLAIHGKLVPQDPTDEPACELLKRINPKVEITCDNGHYQKNKQFEIPSTWVLCKLGAVNEIARGGSPRPIKDYLTYDANGINWIKIGDTTKDGKYINSVKEKIRPEGVKKSRLVHKGDFLLTNSMSYGRPYILNVDGCIHDGWLVISPIGKAYTSDFLYYLLSSSFAYEQFTNVASGGVVTNLNSDKVADTIFPLPPYTEQERIVAKIEEIFAQLDAIEASL